MIFIFFINEKLYCFFIGYCLIYNIGVKKMDFNKCFGINCLREQYILDNVYKCKYVY